MTQCPSWAAGSAVTQLLSHHLSGRPRCLSWPRRGRAGVPSGSGCPAALGRCLSCRQPEPVLPRQPSPVPCHLQRWHLLVPSLSAPGGLSESVLSCSDGDGAGFILMSFPAFSSHATRLRLLRLVIAGLLAASLLSPGCSLELGGSSASSLPAGTRSPGQHDVLGAAGTFPGCCRDLPWLLWRMELPVSRLGPRCRRGGC